MKKHDDHDILFFERQAFRQKWLWIPLVLMSAYLTLALLNEYVFHIKDLPLPETQMVALSWIVMISLIFLFWIMRLETMIKKDGIYFRYRPFNSTYKRIQWSELESAKVRTYKPLREYGGWGLRIGLTAKGMAFSVSGNQGLQLVFKDGKHILIGTRKGQVIQHVLDRYYP